MAKTSSRVMVLPILPLVFVLIGYRAQPVLCRLAGEIRNDQQESRQLIFDLNVFDISNDPKTVIQKDLKWHYPMDSASISRPIDILALGGSVTWGATLEKRHHAYPWLIGSPSSAEHMDSLATAEMGAYYSAMCLESLIPDSAVKSYDVILLDDFNDASESGLEGFALLLKRLRERYPEAIIIYMHIWQLKSLLNQETGLKPDTLGFDKGVNWSWIRSDGTNETRPHISDKIKTLVEQARGYFYYLPIPESPTDAMQWFSNDWWHLTNQGHEVVANGILEMLFTMEKDVFKPKSLGSFGTGDQCFNWFADGSTNITISDAIMKHIPQGSESENYADIWVLETDQDKSGTIHFENKLSTSVPVVLAYMSNREMDTPYSSVEVFIEDQPTVTINPNLFYFPKDLPKVKYAMVGLAKPGHNALQVKRVDEPRRHREVPFRTVGLLLKENIESLKELEAKSPDTNQSTRHVVFCSFEPNPRLKSHFKIDYDVVESVISATFERLSPEWSVHLITKGDEAVQRFSSYSNVQVVDYRNAPRSHNLMRFQNLYLPQSQNDIEYEKFCIYRWIIIYEYFIYLKMRGVPVDHILTLDSDLMVLQNPFLIDHDVDWNGIESYRIVDGGAILWSLQGLNSYEAFIMDIIMSKEKIIELATTQGDKADCVEKRSLLIPCFIAKDGKMKMWHISDMYLYNAWADLNRELRLRKYQFDCFNVDKLYSNQEYLFVRDGSSVKFKRGEDMETVCIIHFQGGAKRYAIPFYAFLHGEASEYLLLRQDLS